MALIKVKPQIGEVGSAHFPATLDRYHNPITMVYVGLIADVDKNRNVLIKDAPFAVPEWRISWFTFGGVMVGNPKFNTLKIRNEDYQIISDLKKKLKKKKIYK